MEFRLWRLSYTPSLGCNAAAWQLPGSSSTSSIPTYVLLSGLVSAPLRRLAFRVDQRGVACDALAGHRDIVSIQFNPCEAAGQPERHYAGRAAAAERIEHGAGDRTAAVPTVRHPT